MASTPSTSVKLAIQLAMISGCSTPATLLLGAACTLARASRGVMSAAWNSGTNLQATRSFSSRISEMMTLPSVKRERSRTLQDVTTVSSLFLKNRSLYHPQFTPHGIQLLPKSIAQPAAVTKNSPTANSAAPAASTPAAAASTTAAANSAAIVAAQVADLRQQFKQAGLKLSLLEHWMEANTVAGLEGAEDMHAADKTKAWRRLKMKKHKINKRRKLNRYKTK